MMLEVLGSTQEPGWVLTHEGYNVLTENAVESRFALGNGFLGMRASRPVSRGPTWVSWLGYTRWASWPRCYVAGLFDRPNTVPPVPALVPVADWSRVRLVLDNNPQLLLDGDFLSSVRQLDMRRGMLLADLSYRPHAGITVNGGELRLVSLADRAVALQLLRFSLDRDGIDVTLEANFAMAGMGMEPLELDRDVCAKLCQPLRGLGGPIAETTPPNLSGAARLARIERSESGLPSCTAIEDSAAVVAPGKGSPVLAETPMTKVSSTPSPIWFTSGGRARSARSRARSAGSTGLANTEPMADRLAPERLLR